MSIKFVDCRVVVTSMTNPASQPYYELLEKVWNLVASLSDPRGPVNVAVPVVMKDIAKEAIRHFTATQAQEVGFYEDLANHTPMVRLVADGYRAGPAGDH